MFLLLKQHVFFFFDICMFKQISLYIQPYIMGIEIVIILSFHEKSLNFLLTVI
jgi:hypothetical protein